MNFFIEKKKRFLLFLFLNPTPWFLLLKLPEFFSEWSKAPFYLISKINSIFSSYNLWLITDLRLVDVYTGRNPFLTRPFYNKLTILIDQFFHYLSYLSPKFYFHRTIESFDPIPFLFFPFWLAGIFLLIKGKRYKPLVLFLAFSFLAFLLSQKNPYFLFPSIFVNLYTANEGLEIIKKRKTKIIFVVLLSSFSLFSLGRMLWLTL